MAEATAPRFQRNLGTLGLDGQTALFAAHAVVVGLGGLGGHVVDQLARCGVGHITGLDPDVFDETNLNRQLLATTQTVGRSKTLVAAERIAAVNPACIFTPFSLRHDQLPIEVWSQASIVVDCLDSIPDRLDLAAICTRHQRVLIHGAVAGWYGQVAVIWPGQNILSVVYPDHGPGWERQLGNPPFTVAITASLMVAQSVKVLLGLEPQGQPHIDFIDVRNRHWDTLDVS